MKSIVFFNNKGGVGKTVPLHAILGQNYLDNRWSGRRVLSG